MKTIKTLLAGQGGNHIMPFLWVHGEEPALLREELTAIRESGVGAVCVEARPHRDFNGPGWFGDLALILEQCRALGMEMWVLDDSHFPTGYADGAVKRDHPALRKQFLYCKVVDFAGPMPHAAALLKYTLRTPKDKILDVRLYKKTGFEEIDPATAIDLTDAIEAYPDAETGRPVTGPMGRALPGRAVGGPCVAVRFDLPAGRWSLAVTAVSYQGGEAQTEGYLNPLDPAATRVLLDTVYQPIYDHFAADFGKTFRGFFSDEPRFGNIQGADDASIGRNSAMDLPWCDGLETLLAQKLEGTPLAGRAVEPLLPLLFLGGSAGAGDTAAHILRFAYMDLVSGLYSENFDGVLARWCHGHGCEHIGHTIEDNNASSRLGYGAGHFYRAMAHQDMAGIDVVLHQLLPGMDDGRFKGMHHTGWDGEFFTYMLGKLGPGLAHLDPKKKGRCLCELFGAYGWGEGNRLGKWLADYMLVRGVNEFVPHAFDPAPFPDPDCPPHFYAHGHNPQYPEFSLLMGYMNRMSEALAGIHRAPVALLYHAEAEWSGAYMPAQRPAAQLARSCIDYELVPADALAPGGAEKGVLTLNGMRFAALVIPYAEALPARALQRVADYLAAGLPVWFVGGLPQRTSEGTALPALPGARTAPLDELAGALAAAGIPELRLGRPAPALRYYHARQPDGDVYFFTNEGLEPIDTVVEGAKPGPAFVYDAFANALVPDAAPFALRLEPYTAKCVVVPDDAAAFAPPANRFPGAPRAVRPLAPQTVALADADGCCRVWGEPMPLTRWVPLDTLPGLTAFAGRARYALPLNLTQAEAARPARLTLTGVPEGAWVTVNGRDAGRRICPPHRYDLTGLLRPGENALTVEVNTTLGRRINDYLSQFMPVEPLGITGGASLELF